MTTILRVRQIIRSVDNLITKILDYIHCDADDNKLDEIKMLFNENVEKFKNDFLHKIDYMQSRIINSKPIYYYLNNLIKADKIIDIMLSYNAIPRVGMFIWGCHTTHLEAIELAFKNNVISYSNINHRICAMNNAMTDIILSARPANQIINAIDIFIKYGYNFNDYYTNFLVLWNPPVFKYIMSLISRPIDYMGELLSGLKKISRNNSFDDIKNVINYIVEIVISIGNINRQDNFGCTDLQYICSDYMSLHIIDLNKAPYYEYLIELLLLNGADINIVDNNNLKPYEISPELYRIVDTRIETKLRSKLVALIKNIILDRDEAIVFVREVSSVLLPDIANVVFDYRYLFDASKHYDLAKEV